MRRLLLFLSVLLSQCLQAKPEVPDWVAKVCASPTPEYAAKAPAVILLDDTNVEVNEQGVAEVHVRRVVRILHTTARDTASSGVFYDSSTDKIREAKSWLIRKGVEVHHKSSADWLDMTLNEPGVAITDLRFRSVSYSNDVLVGDVFCFESSHTTPLLFAHWGWQFDNQLPVVESRLSITLPAGFKIETEMLGGPGPETSCSADGRRYTWAYLALPHKPEESCSPSRARMSSELFLRFLPRPGLASFKPELCRSWQELADWDARINEGQCDSSAALKAKVQELTANCPDLLSRINALCRFVQKIRYVAFKQNMSKGFGWKVRKSSLVLSTGYGDCKDKSNLLQAMLREIGVEAFRTSASSWRGAEMKPDFPSPMQFNHAITAIRVDETVKLPSVVEVKGLGPLLFFDPTDSETALGDLHHSLQGSYVHVSTRGNNALTLLPKFLPKDDFVVIRRIQMALQNDGTVSAQAQINASGQCGAGFRHLLRTATTPKELEALATKQLSLSFSKAIVANTQPIEDVKTQQAGLSFSCSLKSFPQLIQPGKYLVKLDVLSRNRIPVLSEKERHLPVELSPLLQKDEIVLALPQGIVLDELPPEAKVESPYGRYHIRYKQEGQSVRIERELEFPSLQVPVAEYTALKQFLNNVNRADRPSLIIKQGS